MSDYLISFFVLLGLMLLYIRLAKKYNILDVPNHRSSHLKATVRGGGIIFPISLLLSYFLVEFQYSFFVFSVLLLSVVSFLDDLYSLSSKKRFLAQLLAALLIVFDLGLEQVWLYPIILFVLVGGLNAYNFMDGVNGITALYSTVVLASLFWVNQSVHFINDLFILLPLMAVLIFSFFNVRKKAICFAGDVGSVSVALIILFLLLRLITETQDLVYGMFLVIYAIDAGFTVLRRKMNRENILEPHKSHFYQLLVHKKKYAHLTVAFIYAALQAMVNFFVLRNASVLFALVLFLCLSISYIFAYNQIKDAQ